MFCYKAVYEAAEKIVVADHYRAPYPHRKDGAILTICGASFIWIVAILQISAVCVGGPASKPVPYPTEELDSAAEVPKLEVHYA
jgi:hypothetical protein